MIWQLQEAKNQLSRVIEEAKSTGPQTITVRGKETAVVLSAAQYRRLVRPMGSLVTFLRESPWAEVDLDIARSEDKARREVDL